MHFFRLACAVAALSCAAVAQAAPPFTKEAYKAQQLRIEGDYDVAQGKCKSLQGNARRVCYEQVRGERDIAQAQLEMQFKPSADADEKVRLARAEATYAVAVQKCKSMDGSAREVCRDDAKMVFKEAKSEARMQKELVAMELRSQQVVQERTQQADRMAEARFAAARERCEMLPGEGRDNCLADVKRRFDKQ
jgi:hypothetical protein